MEIMRCFGFTGQWTIGFFSAISTVSFSILLNGSPYGFFKPSRGLRQGDPLSPFLFVIFTEVLTRLLKRDEDAHLLHGIRIARNAPPITHLLFADILCFFLGPMEGK